MRPRFKLLLTVSTVLLAVLLFLFSPMFDIRDVQITGNATVPRADIYARLQATHSHLLLFNTVAARSRVMENLYVGGVTFVRAWPGRLYATIHERRLVAYVEHGPGIMLFLCEEGRVLEVRATPAAALPRVVGLPVTRFELGEVLDVPNPEAFRLVVAYTHALARHGLTPYITHIDVADTSNTRILIHNLEFNVGCATDADEKVRVIAAVLDGLPGMALYHGFFDLREIREEYFFTILT